MDIWPLGKSLGRDYIEHSSLEGEVELAKD
jgi:hypothetical protein